MSNLSNANSDKLRQALAAAQQERAEAQLTLTAIAERYDDVAADLYRCQAEQSTLRQQLVQTQAQLRTALKDHPGPR